MLFRSLWRKVGASTMSRVERAIADSEVLHTGEIRVAIEASLDWRRLLSGQSARERALEVFSERRVWDTADNNGVLIYLLLADRDVEIVADRGVAAVVKKSEWEAICLRMEERFRDGLFENALLHGVEAVGRRLSEIYPIEATTSNTAINELPDRPIRL